MLGAVLGARLEDMAEGGLSTAADLEVMVLLLLLHGDEAEEVGAAARTALRAVGARWRGGQWRQLGFAEGAEIVDGEAEMRAQIQAQGQMMQVQPAQERDSSANPTRRLLLDHLSPLASLLLAGSTAWTVDSRRRFLGGLDEFLSVVGSQCVPLLPALLSSLGPGCRDDEPMVRSAAERCCRHVGALVAPSDCLDLVLPRVNGEVPGGDTASARCSAVRVLTCLVQGFASPAAAADTVFQPPSYSIPPATYLGLITASLARPEMYAFAEAYFREALLLLARALLAAHPVQCCGQQDGTGRSIETDLCLCLLFLQGRSECGDIVAKAAASALGELGTLSARLGRPDTLPPPPCGQGGDESHAPVVAALLGRHYRTLLAAITGPGKLQWDPSSPRKAAFECLVRLCPRGSWESWAVVLPVLEEQVQPASQPAQDTPEAHQASYAAQRGDETPMPSAEVGTRLTLLALLEGWVRAGTSDWECGSHLAACAEGIIKKIVVPNLVWRVGRVENTVRKVALAVAYGLLRAGAAPPELLYKAAPELVPLLASSLDDSDTSVVSACTQSSNTSLWTILPQTKK